MFKDFDKKIDRMCYFEGQILYCNEFEDNLHATIMHQCFSNWPSYKAVLKENCIYTE